MIAQFSTTNPEDYSFILTNVTDIVEQKKQEYSAPDFSDIKERLLKSIEQEQAFNSLNIKLAKKQNTLLSQQIKANEFQMKVMEFSSPEDVAALNKKFLSEEYNVNDIAQMAIEKYLNSEIHKSKEKELIDSQESEIVELKKYKALHDARNVLADVDDGK